MNEHRNNSGRLRKKKMAPVKQQSTRDWANLPPELLQLIAKKLPVIFDYSRFRCVCTSWCLAASPTEIQWLPPWLVMRYNKRPTDTISFFNFSDCAATEPHLTLDIPEVGQSLIYSSRHGWLMMIAPPPSAPSPHGSVTLFNPITRAQIMLPQLPLGPNLKTIKKAILCSHPTSPRPRQLLVVVWMANTLAILKHGDNAWTLLDGLLTQIDHIVYFDEELYFVQKNGKFAVFEFDTLKIKTLSLVAPQPLSSGFIVSDAAGDILLITWIYYIQLHRYKSSEVSVYKLERSRCEDWKWESIGNIDICPGELFCLIDFVYVQGLPDCQRYRIFVCFGTRPHTCNIQEIELVPGVRITKHPSRQITERSCGKNWCACPQMGLNWIVPSLH